MSNWEAAQTLQASAAQTSTGAGASVDLGTRDRLLRQTLLVTAATGASISLIVRLEASADGTTGWRTFGTFTQCTGQTTEKLSFVAPERYVRVAWTIAGATPSFTFSVAGTKGVSYANLDHLDALGMPIAAMTGLTPTKRAEALAATTELASGILAARYTMPLAAWGNDLTQACCKITAYDLLSVRGFNPDGDDENVRKRYEDAMKWLKDVAAGAISPIGLVEAPPSEDDDSDNAGVGGFVVTHAARPWR